MGNDAEANREGATFLLASSSIGEFFETINGRWTTNGLPSDASPRSRFRDKTVSILFAFVVADEDGVCSVCARLSDEIVGGARYLRWNKSQSLDTQAYANFVTYGQPVFGYLVETQTLTICTATNYTKRRSRRRKLMIERGWIEIKDFVDFDDRRRGRVRTETVEITSLYGSRSCLSTIRTVLNEVWNKIATIANRRI